MTSFGGLNDKAVVRGVELRLDTAFDGATNHFPAGIQEVVVNGKKLDKVGLQREIDGERAPWKDARAAHAVVRQFALDKPRLEKETAELLACFEAALIAHFGPESEELTKFGFTPKKRPRALTAEEQALKVAKARLTRAKRAAARKAEPVPPPPPPAPTPAPAPQPSVNPTTNPTTNTN